MQIKPEKQSVKTVVVAGGAPGNVVTGARTAVMMGGVSVDTVPGVDLDRVAASMSEQSRDMSASVSSLPQPGAAGAKQLGRSIAGVITGIKSKFVNSMTGPLATRSSPSPPDTNKTAKIREVPIRVEQSGAGIMHSAGAGENSPHVIPLTVPGAEYGRCQDRLFGICDCIPKWTVCSHFLHKIMLSFHSSNLFTIRKGLKDPDPPNLRKKRVA